MAKEANVTIFKQQKSRSSKNHEAAKIMKQQKSRQSAKSPSDHTTPGIPWRNGTVDLRTRRRMLRVGCNAKPTVPSPCLPSRNARLKIGAAALDPSEFGSLPQASERLSWK